MPRRAQQGGEEGASLVIALVFVVAIGLILLALISLTGTNLADTANLENGRALEYTADGTVDAAVQSIRYQSPVTACSATSPFSVTTTSGPVNGSNVNVAVYCQVAALQYERQVTLTACPSSDSLASCQTVHSTGTSDAILVAQVLYTDAGSCSSGGPGCGQTATVLNWSLQRSNN